MADVSKPELVLEVKKRLASRGMDQMNRQDESSLPRGTAERHVVRYWVVSVGERGKDQGVMVSLTNRILVKRIPFPRVEIWFSCNRDVKRGMDGSWPF